MKKDILINIFLEFLAPVVNPKEEGNDSSAVEVLFFSKVEARICDSPGQNLPTHLDCSGNKLARDLWKIADYDYISEEKNYAECLSEEDEEAAEAFDERGEYNPDLVTGHIYHSLRFIKDLLAAYEKATGDNSYREKPNK